MTYADRVDGHEWNHEQSECRALKERCLQREHAAQRCMQSVKSSEDQEPCEPIEQSPPRSVGAHGPERGVRR